MFNLNEISDFDKRGYRGFDEEHGHVELLITVALLGRNTVPFFVGNFIFCVQIIYIVSQNSFCYTRDKFLLKAS